MDRGEITEPVIDAAGQTLWLHLYSREKPLDEGLFHWGCLLFAEHVVAVLPAQDQSALVVALVEHPGHQLSGDRTALLLITGGVATTTVRPEGQGSYLVLDDHPRRVRVRAELHRARGDRAPLDVLGAGDTRDGHKRREPDCFQDALLGCWTFILAQPLQVKQILAAQLS